MSNRREVRWLAQCSKRYDGLYRDWKTRDDIIYSGWFFSNGNDEPSEIVIEQFNEAKESHSWLDWRLVQETRSFEQRVVA